MKKVFCVIMALMLTIGGFAGIAANREASAAESETELLTEYSVPGGNYLGVVSETIYYADKIETSYMLKPGLPGYSSGLGCGIVAGGNIIAWYNYKLANGNSIGPLIPNHTIATYFMGTFIWGSSSPGTSAMFSQLSIDMNAVAGGVTISGYLNGMNTYVTRKGFTFSKTKMMGTGGLGNVLKSSYKTDIKSGKLMTIFIDGFFLGGLEALQEHTASGYDTFAMEEYMGAHVMAVYGYKEVSYLNAQGQMFRQDIYLIVHTGFGGALGMTRITNINGTFDDAYITHIY